MPSISDLQKCVAILNRLLPGREIVCAGGGPRDVLNNKPIKDLDFFIGDAGVAHYQSGAHYRLNELFAMGTHKKDGEQLAPAEVTGGVSSYGGKEYSDFWTIEYPVGWFGLPIQLVYVKDCFDLRQSLMENFDFGLSRVWVDANRLRWTPEYWRDVENKRLTFFGSGWGKTSPERIARLRAKYSDFKFVNRDRNR